MNKYTAKCVLAYALWGALPVYWKLLSGVSSLYTLCCRSIFSFLFALALVACNKDWKLIKTAFSDRKKLFYGLATGFLTTASWALFLIAVNSGRILDASLANFIQPMGIVAIGVLFYHEKMSKPELAAVLLAAAGIACCALSYGKVPWMALSMVTISCLYAVCKRNMNVPVRVSFFIETVTFFPAMLLVLGYLEATGQGGYFAGGWQMGLLLVATGLATGVPILLYTDAIGNMSMTAFAFCQFLQPTLMFASGLLYGEAFDAGRAAAFGLIWIGVIVYVSSITLFSKGRRIRHAKA